MSKSKSKKDKGYKKKKSKSGKKSKYSKLDALQTLYTNNTGRTSKKISKRTVFDTQRHVLPYKKKGKKMKGGNILTSAGIKAGILSYLHARGETQVKKVSKDSVQYLKSYISGTLTKAIKGIGEAYIAMHGHQSKKKRPKVVGLAHVTYFHKKNKLKKLNVKEIAKSLKAKNRANATIKKKKKKEKKRKYKKNPDSVTKYKAKKKKARKYYKKYSRKLKKATSKRKKTLT